jgi:uncharacterized pyridoxamine 5'-phosphate oxidase family protein
MDPRSLAEQILTSTDVAFLATCDGDQPCVRPVNVALREGFTLWIASYAFWGKVRQLQQNVKVEVCVMESTGAHVRIVGQGLIRADMTDKQRVFDAFPLMRHYFPNAADPNYTLIEIVPAAISVKGAWELDYHDVPLISTT